MILRSAFLTAYQNLSILTIPISLSDISDKSTVQQSENSENPTVRESDNSGSLIIWQSDHSNNSDEPIWHFWWINCLTIQHFQQSNSPRIIPTIMISLSNSVHANPDNFNEPIWHFGQISSLTIWDFQQSNSQRIQQCWLAYPTVPFKCWQFWLAYLIILTFWQSENSTIARIWESDHSNNSD